MNRRGILLGTGIALSTSLAGCIGEVTPADDEPSSNGDENGDGTENGDDPAPQCDATDANGDVEDLPRVDEPPQTIDVPEGADDDWNEEYLGACMATEPSLSFEVVSRAQRVVDGGLQHGEGEPEEYWAALVASESDREEVFDVQDEEVRERIEAVDLEESVLVVVQSGWGSGSIEHRWARVEGIAGGPHLHGYYTRPMGGTDDYTYRSSVLEVERPAEATVAHVSLTVSEDRRVHFDSTEGVVGLAE